MREKLPAFNPSEKWMRLARTDSYDVYEKSLSEKAVFEGDPYELFTQHSMGVKPLESLYVGPSGKVFLISSHTHNWIAQDVLTEVDPSLPRIKKKGLRDGGYKHTDLTKASGIQRIQIYPDGMGVTIEMANPPNKAQLNTIRELYKNTPMDKFVAEIVHNGKRIRHLQSFSDCVRFINTFDPDDPHKEFKERDPLLTDRM